VLGRGEDPGVLVGDRPGELDGGSQAAAPGPLQPAVERLDGGVGREPVDLAELFCEQVGAEQRGVELLDPGELGLLAVGEVLGVLPEREPRALQVARELVLASAPGLVSDLAANVVERVPRQLDHVERVHAADRVGQPLSDWAGDSRGHVARHQCDLFAALLAQGVKERRDGLAVTAGGHPDQPPLCRGRRRRSGSADRRGG